MTRREAFSRNSSPLYLIELLNFVKMNDDYSTEAVDQADIAFALDFVNKNRVDAHAKDITDVDYERLKRIFVVLEDIFLPPA